MSRLNQVILAIVVSIIFCLVWDAAKQYPQTQEVQQQYFPVTPIFNVQVGGHMTYTEIGK